MILAALAVILIIVILVLCLALARRALAGAPKSTPYSGPLVISRSRVRNPEKVAR